jgi:hypothetical protein
VTNTLVFCVGPSSPVREREIKREGERAKERERKKRGRERERIVILFLKGMTGALATFSYLVRNNK